MKDGGSSVIIEDTQMSKFAEKQGNRGRGPSGYFGGAYITGDWIVLKG